jgi:hypothetical protein
MKKTRVLLPLLVFLGTPAVSQGSTPWSVAVGLGAVDQNAIGGAPTASIELAYSPATALSLGLRSGYFTKDDGGGSRRDTLYAVAFGRARWPRSGIQPFVEAGGGRYEFEGHPLEGWFGGLGADLPFSAHRGLLLALRYHSVPRPPNGPLPDFAEAQVALSFSF